MIELGNFRNVSARSKTVALRIAAGTAIIASTVLVLPALATPGSGFSGAPQSLASFDELDVKADKTGHWDLSLKTKDVTDLGVDKLTIQPSGFSGWQVEVRKNRSGILLSPQNITDGDLVGARLPRSSLSTGVQPGRGLANLGDGELTLLQLPNPVS